MGGGVNRPAAPHLPINLPVGVSAEPVLARTIEATAPLVSLRAVDLNYGAVPALRGVSLQIARGERVALVGANGAGKTTLLKVMNGLLAPSAGERLLPPVDGRAPRTAMLFQRPFLLRLSVQRNLLLALWLAGVPAAARRARAAEALQRVGLDGLAQRSAQALSGGQQQRLALARAWCVHPDVLYLDEPTASLDPSAKREVEALVDDFARTGMALVVSSHNLGQVKRLTQRVLFLDAGRVLADVSTDDFFNRSDLGPEALQFLKGELPWT